MLMLLQPVQAESQPAVPDFTSVVKVTFTNPEDGLPSSCTGVMISQDWAVTSASCVMAEEKGRQVRQAKVCANGSAPSVCIDSQRILTHSGYLGIEQVNNANNLAYIQLQRPFSTERRQIKAIKELSPSDFNSLARTNLAGIRAYLISYDGSGISIRSPITRSTSAIEGLEMNFHQRLLELDSHQVRLGHHYQGAAVLVDWQGDWYLLGLLAHTTPDRVVFYKPEENPCDEDPIQVRYGEPLLRSHLQITPYAMAACGMLGYQNSAGYDELSCTRMQRNLALDAVKASGNAVALRQQAELYLQSENPTLYVRDIYQLLTKASAQGDIKASELLAQVFITGDVLPQDMSMARQLLLTEEGKPISTYASLLLGREALKAYNEDDLRSINTQVDAELLALLEPAANAGYAEAQYYLARLYQFGVGVSASNKAAYNWYAKAAMQGEPRAQFQMGTMWVDGRGVRAYPEVGHYWIRQAAAQGYIRAQNYLAMNQGQDQINNALKEYELEYSES